MNTETRNAAEAYAEALENDRDSQDEALRLDDALSVDVETPDAIRGALEDTLEESDDLLATARAVRAALEQAK